MFSTTKLELRGKRLKCLEQIREVFELLKQRIGLTKEKIKINLPQVIFKQGIRLLTIRRVMFSSSFRTEEKWVVELETELLSCSQSV